MLVLTLLIEALLLVASTASALLWRDNTNSWETKPWAELSVSAPHQGRYLHRSLSGDPFLWVADTNWELFHRMNKTDIDLYLADRASKGFNVIMAVVASKYNATTLPNFYNEVVFHNADPSQPNEKYFEFVDFVVERAASYDILIVMLPTWGRWVNYGWYGKAKGDVLFNETNAENYGYFLGKRYPGIPKMLGGDSNAFWADNVPDARTAWEKNKSIDPFTVLDPIVDTRNIWSAMLRGLKRGETEYNFDSFAFYHPTAWWITGTPKAYGHNMLNGSFGRVSMDVVQSGHQAESDNLYPGINKFMQFFDSTKNYEYIMEMRDQFPGPVVDVENHYEGAHHDFVETTPIWNASEVRHGYYAALFSGACGYTYGGLPTQQSFENLSLVSSLDHYMEPQLGLSANSSWHEALHYPGSRQTGYPALLFSSLSRAQFDALIPSRHLISSPPGSKEDVLTFEGQRYISAISTSGHFWVHSGYGDAFQVDLTAIAQRWGMPDGTRVRAQWFDPRTGKVRDFDGPETFLATGSQTFTPPTSGGADYDWVLVIKSTGVC